MRPDATPITLSPDEARRRLLAHHHLDSPSFPPGDEGARALLKALRCIQLDPLAPLGTNADLVAMARVEGLTQGQIYSALLPGYAFEHFAKERCLLPATAFPWYRDRAVETPWWRLSERLKRIPQGILDKVEAEIAAIGPCTVDALSQRGRVRPLDWSGWKGTAKASRMAVEVLATRCRVVVCGRSGRGKIYGVPSRALPAVAAQTVAPGAEAFARWAIEERAHAAGMLARASGPQWSMLSEARTGPVPEDLIQEGRLIELRVEGSKRPYLAPPAFLERPTPAPDEHMRILGPLDPLLWDRKLVHLAFGFEYIWEVYKPAEKRRWGWYVCPLLHRGQLVGRLEGRVRDGTLEIDRIWTEGQPLDAVALDRCLERHAQALGAAGVQRPADKEHIS